MPAARVELVIIAVGGGGEHVALLLPADLNGAVGCAVATIWLGFTDFWGRIGSAPRMA